jgi:hypothetical protein
MDAARAAAASVLPSHGHPFARANRRNSTFPSAAATAQTSPAASQTEPSGEVGIFS